MTAPDASRAPHRSAWVDVRLVLGVILVVASIAGVWFVVAAARQTTPVLAAAHTIVPGEVVTRDDLRVVDVALGAASDTYMIDSVFVEGVVATRTIEEGELVPHAAVATADAVRTASVVVRTSADVPASIDVGAVVELWSAPLVDRNVYDTPRILVADATVAALTRDDSAIGGGAVSVELVVPRADVAVVLSAIADQSALSIVSAGVRS
ncbi:SAF domain-containing protein [Microbacterium sp. C7(2022)]|uniref:SAF domain-containing protein n=1 Tax=Microbacterium sp. C7(2022) TaxID=2992759 RepID=UPI00237A791B|nr:SAF domain-containing protein [Microbacterium sp. C7(2022)]MDE0547286.1 SAF domain-containing protein [Microbacterium sp. C7(2022)]